MEIDTGLKLGDRQADYQGETGIYNSWEALTWDDDALGLVFILQLDSASFMLTPGYVNSELAEGYGGSASFDGGVLTLEPYDGGRYTYRVGVFGDSLQLIQTSEQGIRYGRGPGSEMTFFFYEPLTDGQ